MPTVLMLKNNSSYLAIVFVAFVCVWNIFNIHLWDSNGVMCWDEGIYYSYFPTALNVSPDSLAAVTTRFPGMKSGINYVLLKDPQTSNGHRVIKMSMGMAMLFTPFYLAGFLQHYLAHGNAGTGYDIEYLRTMAFFGLTCLIIGLFVLRRVLKTYFTDGIVALTLITIVFGTNCFYYTDYEGCMAHVAGFMLYAIFILLTGLWYSKPGTLYSVLWGLVAGLLILIRPSNIVLLVVFPLYNVSGAADLKARVKLLSANWNLFVLTALAIVLVWVPQMLYWHHLTGHYVYYSYTVEPFYFSNPRLADGLLSWRKGWLIYTPLGWLMLIGFIPMRRYAPKLMLPFGIFLCCYLYFIFSWWCWYYGGSFSSRPMVETYALLAFPLASLYNWVYQSVGRPKLKIAFSLLLLVLVSLNLFQTYQYTHAFIHYSGMTFKAYQNTFLQLHEPPDSLLVH
jgi:hypothetical protein